MGAVPTSATTLGVRHPQWTLTYQGVAITGDILDAVTEVSYENVVTGAAGEVQITLEDRNKKWQGPWYPQQGDVIALQIGYVGETLLNCGTFQVDELELEGPPDVFKIRAIPTYITPAIRTRNSIGYEGQSLSQIATTIAAKFNLTLVNAPTVINVTYQRVTQKHETDLGFLKRIAAENNYAFTIRGTKMIFYSVPAMEANPSLLTIQRTDVEKFEFKGKAFQIYQGSQVSYMDPTTKQLITATTPAPVASPTGDTLKVISRVESPQQASLKSQGTLHKDNQLFTTGNLTLPGNVSLIGGINLTIEDFGAYSGTYFVMKATHKLDRESGYKTEVELRRVPS